MNMISKCSLSRVGNINYRRTTKLRSIFQSKLIRNVQQNRSITVGELRAELLNNNFNPENYGFQTTKNQKIYVQNLNVNQLNIVIGSPGTGKTMLATGHALENLKNNSYEKIIITRPTVTVDEENGYLPGDINQKMAPWLAPLFDNFNLFTTRSNLDYLLKSGKIEIVPLSYIRGRTFDNTILIADEMQNSTINQMKTLLTRMGTNSKCIITGDLNQSDLDNEVNGLIDFLNRFYKHGHDNCFINEGFIGVSYLTVDDIKRSDLVRNIIDIYEKK